MVQRVRDMDIDTAAMRTGTESMAAYVAMIDDLSPADFSATETFDRDLSRSVGSIRVELHHIDRGHTDNDAFVYLPDANVIHGGDLFFNRIHPRIDVSSGRHDARVAAMPRRDDRCRGREHRLYSGAR